MSTRESACAGLEYLRLEEKHIEIKTFHDFSLCAHISQTVVCSLQLVRRRESRRRQSILRGSPSQSDTQVPQILPIIPPPTVVKGGGGWPPQTPLPLSRRGHSPPPEKFEEKNARVDEADKRSVVRRRDTAHFSRTSSRSWWKSNTVQEPTRRIPHLHTAVERPRHDLRQISGERGDARAVPLQ